MIFQGRNSFSGNAIVNVIVEDLLGIVHGEPGRLLLLRFS
jgi:hypothetical protein